MPHPRFPEGAGRDLLQCVVVAYASLGTGVLTGAGFGVAPPGRR
jgi:hypothetical protein